MKYNKKDQTWKAILHIQLVFLPLCSSDYSHKLTHPPLRLRFIWVSTQIKLSLFLSFS